jgi:hypothetical protein
MPVASLLPRKPPRPRDDPAEANRLAECRRAAPLGGPMQGRTEQPGMWTRDPVNRHRLQITR